MATLYLARRRGVAGFSRPVAIKVVHPHLSDDPRFVSMFVDEALLCSRIDHPHVVRVDELAEVDGYYYLVMEYVQGCSLATFVRIVRDTGRRIAPELAVAVAARVAAGLDVVHELTLEDGRPAAVVHRDVTPSNVLLGYRGDVKYDWSGHIDQHVGALEKRVEKLRDPGTEVAAGRALPADLALQPLTRAAAGLSAARAGVD